MKRWLSVLLAAGSAVPALAVEFRTVDTATVLYDAPSPRGNKLFVIKRDTPVELVVHLEGWAKVRDSDGAMAWLESKYLGLRHSVVVVAARAQVRKGADDAAALVFEAERNVALDYLEVAPGGWVKVRHRDGQSGYVRADQIWGL
ncbi:MAG: SH3 domain protein [Candidatus Accumulibacter regalis]|jgi:SH3-like domain-containing protein|uniref:SH3 domain protein n=1 Tax=Accumulibacter regalis TaxID=522306 RepID=A0A011QIE9_ACCRE|nr:MULTISPECIES: SH3 domain-containing protein [unclassified Candidatus Accumulibacter]EXI88825.1 MAG: SH3 domain protein [Candidatus Accumulibacter regalis]MQM34054.1 SH3 domain-containing protein [Candidatus Accumulibacter phosphatis]MBL8366756.1 SH3 domain-containing protein [Accumulibacter sp.]MBN8512756.1 SH3 domain-containing protein [Accumulibacter sp.]MBO3701482.1 SH3 domain-containing protein [Accumulibacter sp.]